MSSLSFIDHPKKYSLSIYMSKDKPVGRLAIYVENENQKQEVEQRKWDVDASENVYIETLKRRED